MYLLKTDFSKDTLVQMGRIGEAQFISENPVS